VPSTRGFKIGENDTPRPMDRAYFSFNYFDDLNNAANRAAGADLHDVRIYREVFGAEMTFLDGDASVGLRVPLNTLAPTAATRRWRARAPRLGTCR
jgi:hypothetical protein